MSDPRFMVNLDDSSRKKPKSKYKKRVGFSAMTEDRRKEVARQGGLQAHRMGVAHEFTSEEARKAIKKRNMK